MSEKANNNLSGTKRTITIDIPQQPNFLGINLPTNDFRIDATKLTKTQQNNLKSFLVDFVTEISGVDGTPTPQVK